MKANIKKTQAYYHSIKPESLCQCNYCKNYYAQIKAAYPEAASYLASLGIDITKPFELSPLEPDKDSFVTYSPCQYLVFGTCTSAYRHKIGAIEFRAASSYPSTGIKEEHFVLEFDPIRLPLILPL